MERRYANDERMSAQRRTLSKARERDKGIYGKSRCLSWRSSSARWPNARNPPAWPIRIMSGAMRRAAKPKKL